MFRIEGLVKAYGNLTLNNIHEGVVYHNYMNDGNKLSI